MTKVFIPSAPNSNIYGASVFNSKTGEHVEFAADWNDAQRRAKALNDRQEKLND